MEATVADIVIVEAGIAGLTTSLGIPSLVLESSDTLRSLHLLCQYQRKVGEH